MNMSPKETLILFLINANPGIKDVRKLGMLLDRANFPGKESESLQILIEKKFIFVERLFPNKTPLAYNSTEMGRTFLKENFVESEIIGYIKSMSDPSFLLELTSAYIKKANDSNSISST